MTYWQHFAKRIYHWPVRDEEGKELSSRDAIINGVDALVVDIAKDELPMTRLP